MKIKRNYNLLSKQLKFFLIRIVLCLFTCLNTSYAMSDMNPTDPFVKLLVEEVKHKSFSSLSRDSSDLIGSMKYISPAVEGYYINSKARLQDSLTLFVLADVLYGLTFLPFRFTKNHIFRKITRSFAKVIFFVAVIYAAISNSCNGMMMVVTKEMNAMNKEFNDLISDLQYFIRDTVPELRSVVRYSRITASPKLESSTIQNYSVLLCAIGYLSFAIISIEMFYSWVVTRNSKLPPKYAAYILFAEVMILLGSHIFATSLLCVRKQNAEGEIIFIDWVKNFRRVTAISILDDILNLPKAQDLLKSSNLNMKRNGSDYNRMVQKVLNTRYTDYDSIRENGEHDTNPF